MHGIRCIACSLAYEHPDVRVIATDVAPEAVALAKENTEALGLADRVAVLQCSLGSGIGEKRMGTFDAVVSNPPYVPTAVMAGIPREVADFEPTARPGRGRRRARSVPAARPVGRSALSLAACSPASCMRDTGCRPVPWPKQRDSSTCISWTI